MATLAAQWHALFTLCAIQFGLFANDTLGKLQTTNNGGSDQTVVEQLRQTRIAFEALGVDAFEYSCLRAVLLLQGIRRGARMRVHRPQVWHVNK
jgi:hypothetical protein